MKQTVRTFIALEPGPAVQGAATKLVQSLRGASADVKWVETHNLHLTLKFLGEVPLREIPAVLDAVSQAVDGLAPCEREIRGAGGFPTAARPRTIWLGPGAGAEPMCRLQKQIEQVLDKKLGYRPEGRRFQPHLTIGRVRGGGANLAELGRLLQQHSADEFGVVSVDEVVVFSSQLGPGGPTYEALGRVELPVK